MCVMFCHLSSLLTGSGGCSSGDMSGGKKRPCVTLEGGGDDGRECEGPAIVRPLVFLQVILATEALATHDTGKGTQTRVDPAITRSGGHLRDKNTNRGLVPFACRLRSNDREI